MIYYKSIPFIHETCLLKERIIRMDSFDFSARKRVVIKVGTSTLTYKTGNINMRRVKKMVEVLSDLKNEGHDIILVSSGAVGVGVGCIGLQSRPTDMPTKQACAAVGQSKLMGFYQDEFGRFNHTVAQILATRDVFSNKIRRENIFNTMHTLLSMGIIPIINANDSVSIEQLDFDENDTLSALIAEVASADLLVILTDVDGLYDKNPSEPDAKLIPVVHKVTDEMIAAAGEKGSELASGGMLTKIEAAVIAGENGIPTAIIRGDNPEYLYELFDNKAICTLFDLK